jgi:tripartite-type tricarboxylate transporter receptor subunit TctC
MKKYILFFMLLIYFGLAKSNDITTILVGFPPGGGNYLLAQATSDAMNRLGHTTVIESKPGANGLLGVNECIRRKSEKTICLVSQTQYAHSLVYNTEIRKFDPDEFVYVKLMAATPLVMFTNSKNKKSIEEILVDLRTPASKPIFFGSSSIGLQIPTNWFFKQAGATNAERVEYKGVSQIITDIMGSHIDYSIAFYSSVKKHYEQGSVRIVSIIGDTMGDQNLEKIHKIQKIVPKMDSATQKFGFIMSPDSSTDRVNYYNNILSQVLNDPKFKEQLEQDGAFIYNSNLTPHDFSKLAKQERVLLKNQINLMKLKLEEK